MKATVTEVFIDKFNGKVYGIGEIIDISDTDRLKDLSDRKLIQVAEEIVEKKPAVKKKKDDVKCLKK